MEKDGTDQKRVLRTHSLVGLLASGSLLAVCLGAEANSGYGAWHLERWKVALFFLLGSAVVGCTLGLIGTDFSRAILQGYLAFISLFAIALPLWLIFGSQPMDVTSKVVCLALGLVVARMSWGYRGILHDLRGRL